MDAAAPDRAGFVEVNRMRLRLWEWGPLDGPPVICVHGAYDHGRMWDGLAPRLAGRGWRVVAPDLRGHGDSGRLSSGHVWAAMALDLALLARHLGPPAGFVGHSFGAGQAAYVAGVWPELVRWLVILDGLGPPPAVFVEGDLAAVATDGLAAAERILLGPPRVHASLHDMASRRGRVNIRLSKAWLDHLVGHGAREVEGGYVWKVDPLFSVGLPASFNEAHLHAEHELVSCPTLVLTGAEPDTWSDLTPDEVRDRLAHLRSARHHVIDGAGHYLHLEQPDVVLAAIADFTADVDTQEAP